MSYEEIPKFAGGPSAPNAEREQGFPERAEASATLPTKSVCAPLTMTAAEEAEIRLAHKCGPKTNLVYVTLGKLLRELDATRERLERAEAGVANRLRKEADAADKRNSDETAKFLREAADWIEQYLPREAGFVERGKDSATAPTKEA